MPALARLTCPYRVPQEAKWRHFNTGFVTGFLNTERANGGKEAMLIKSFSAIIDTDVTNKKISIFVPSGSYENHFVPARHAEITMTLAKLKDLKMAIEEMIAEEEISIELEKERQNQF
jgi:hypothetical protein